MFDGISSIHEVIYVLTDVAVAVAKIFLAEAPYFSDCRETAMPFPAPDSAFGNWYSQKKRPRKKLGRFFLQLAFARQK